MQVVDTLYIIVWSGPVRQDDRKHFSLVRLFSVAQFYRRPGHFDYIRVFPILCWISLISRIR